jgi:HK97 family phage portal protein
VGVFVRERAANPALERRFLTFISPPVGAYTQALQDWSAADPEGAMRTHAVWRCVNKIALSLAMMRPSAWRGPAYGVGTSTRIDPLPQMLVQPSSDCSTMEFTYATWVSLGLRGNVYGLILDRDRLGYPTQIELQHPDQVRVRKRDDVTYEYRLRNELVDPAVLWHKAIHRMPGSRVGMSPIQYAARYTRWSQSAETFGLEYFQDGGHPSAVLSNKNVNKINQDQAQKVKETFLAATRGSREPVVMAGGWSYEQIQIKPNESQFLDAIGATSEMIAGFFGMTAQQAGFSPPGGKGSTITYQNIEQSSLDFLLYPITPWLLAWEEWQAQWLPRGVYVKCDTAPLVRTDILTRWRAYDLMVGSHALTPDEIRELDDRPPLTAEQTAQIAALAPMPKNVSYPATQE